jgi:hypothetical protein
MKAAARLPTPLRTLTQSGSLTKSRFAKSPKRAAFEKRDHGATDIHRAHEIDLDHAPPFVERIFLQRHRRPRKAGVVDKNIDPGQSAGRAFDRSVVGHVDGRLIRSSGRVHIPPDRTRAAGPQRRDNGGADATQTAGDDSGAPPAPAASWRE